MIDTTLPTGVTPQARDSWARARERGNVVSVTVLTHQVEELTKRTEEQNRRAGEQNRRWFVLGVIITLGSGWLFWRLPQPQPQRRDVRISDGTDHGVRGGGTPSITPPQVVSLSAVIVGGGCVSATLTQTPVESKTATVSDKRRFS